MKRVLYLGTDPSRYVCEGEIIHYPIIRIVPRDFKSAEIQGALSQMPLYTHLIFTSKHTVDIFFSNYKESLSSKIIIAIGKVTASKLESCGHPPQFIAENETQEGVIACLETMDLQNAFIFLPCSAIARDNLSDYLAQANISFCKCALYDTLPQKPHALIDLASIDEIVFTSPSTVHAFLELFGTLPNDKIVTALGPITQAAINEQKCIFKKS